MPVHTARHHPPPRHYNPVPHPIRDYIHQGHWYPAEAHSDRNSTALAPQNSIRGQPNVLPALCTKLVANDIRLACQWYNVPEVDNIQRQAM